jgi:GNAT superfamily N-acetyltransferase
MRVIPVDSKSTEQSWLNTDRTVYHDDPNWIPHIRQDIESIFNPAKNKLFREGNAKRWIVTDDSGRAIGRIAAFWSRKYSSAQKQPTGGIGFFECTRNEPAAKLLLDTACEWLRAEGMEAVDGPINFGEKEAYWGLLVENFTDMSSFRMNYGRPYYKGFFEEYGFQTYYEQLCYKRDLSIPAQEVFVRKSNQLMSEPGYRIGTARGRSTEQIAHDFVTIYNAAWAGLPGFKTMKKEQALKAVAAMKPVMDPDIMVFVYHFDKPIGFYINLPEVNEFMQHVNGNLNWWGILKFLYYKKFGKRNTMVGIVFGVDREYHGKGVEGAMIKFCEEEIVSLNRYKDTILTWIGDFNPKMIHIAENLGASLYRKLITYRLLFDKSRPFERHPMQK